MPNGTAAESSASYHLTSKLVPHLDRHLVLPLLDFVESRSLYSHDDVLKAKYELLKPTNMVTYVLGIKREIEGKEDDDTVPEGALARAVQLCTTQQLMRGLRYTEFRERELTVKKTLEELQSQAQSVMDTISTPDVVSALRQDKQHNLTYLKDNFGVRICWLCHCSSQH